MVRATGSPARAPAGSSPPPPPPGNGGQRAAPRAFNAPLTRKKRQVPAWLLSAGLHAVLFIAAALLMGGVARVQTPEPVRPGGIVLVQPTSTETRYLNETDITNSSAGDTAATEAKLTESLPRPSDLAVDLAGVLPSQSETIGAGGNLADVLPGAGDLAPGVGRTGVTGSQAKTSVFGAQGIGAKFVYVFDRSGSMEGFGGRPLAAAKRELIKSLAPLDSVHEFQIIFYNKHPKIFNPNPALAPRLIYGTERDKRLAESFVRSIVADGGTEHMEPLKLALGMAPDVIFFLTDADDPELSPQQLAEIRRMNNAGTTINTIEFGSKGPPTSENFLMRLAHENGGKHVFVDLNSLKDE